MGTYARFFAATFVALSMLAVGVVPAPAATKMPAFQLEDVMTGRLVDSGTFKGKALLVVFFATWCRPCIQEIPNLIELQSEYGNRQFTVVGLSVDQEDAKEAVKALVAGKGINYPVLMADAVVTRDFGGVYGIPTSFLVNNRGTVVKKYTGYVPHSVLMRDIKEIMK